LILIIYISFGKGNELSMSNFHVVNDQKRLLLQGIIFLVFFGIFHMRVSMKYWPK